MADPALIAAVLDGSIVADLGTLEMAALRERRAQVEAVEVEVSYRRRVLHGHLDLLRAEIGRRDLREEGGPVTSLLDSLGDSGEHGTVRSPSHQRVTADFEGDGEDGPFSGDLPDCSDDELRARGEALVAQERVLSDQRRTVLGRLDAVQDEIVRRYRDGLASIDEILPSSP